MTKNELEELLDKFSYQITIFRKRERILVAQIEDIRLKKTGYPTDEKVEEIIAQVESIQERMKLIEQAIIRIGNIRDEKEYLKETFSFETNEKYSGSDYLKWNLKKFLMLE